MSRSSGSESLEPQGNRDSVGSGAVIFSVTSIEGGEDTEKQSKEQKAPKKKKPAYCGHHCCQPTSKLETANLSLLASWSWWRFTFFF